MQSAAGPLRSIGSPTQIAESADDAAMKKSLCQQVSAREKMFIVSFVDVGQMRLKKIWKHCFRSLSQGYSRKDIDEVYNTEWQDTGGKPNLDELPKKSSVATQVNEGELKRNKMSLSSRKAPWGAFRSTDSRRTMLTQVSTYMLSAHLVLSICVYRQRGWQGIQSHQNIKATLW